MFSGSVEGPEDDLRAQADRRLFTGLDLLDPGVVPMPAPGDEPLPDTATNMYAAVGRKP